MVVLVEDEPRRDPEEDRPFDVPPIDHDADREGGQVGDDRQDRGLESEAAGQPG